MNIPNIFKKSDPVREEPKKDPLPPAPHPDYAHLLDMATALRVCLLPPGERKTEHIERMDKTIKYFREQKARFGIE